MNDERMSESEYVDAEAAGSSKETLLNFRIIVMLHLQRICQLQCVEFVPGGYYRTITQMVNGLPRTEKVWIPDPKMSYINSVVALHNLLASHVCKPVSKKKAADHRAIVAAAFEKVESGLRSASQNDAAKGTDLLFATHALFRALVGFLNDKNFLSMQAEEDV